MPNAVDYYKTDKPKSFKGYGVRATVDDDEDKKKKKLKPKHPVYKKKTRFNRAVIRPATGGNTRKKPKSLLYR